MDRMYRDTGGAGKIRLLNSLNIADPTTVKNMAHFFWLHTIRFQIKLQLQIYCSLWPVALWTVYVVILPIVTILDP